jgi:hypothetical protein
MPLRWQQDLGTGELLLQFISDEMVFVPELNDS